jgi:hypothetical protein
MAGVNVLSCSMRVLISLLAAVALGLGGCQPKAPQVSADPDFETDDFKRAREKYELRDFPAAIELYDGVVRANPQMAKAHLELGMIYDDKLNDYVSSIYHYKRYLRLRPDGDTAKKVEEFIARAEMQLAARVPNSPVPAADELARLQKENLALKAEIEDFRRGRPADATRPSQAPAPEEAVAASVPEAKPAPEAAGQGAGTATGAQPPKVVPLEQAMRATVVRPVAQSGDAGTNAPGVAASSSDPRTYVIQPGDTITKIARKMYPKLSQTEGVKRITDANREKFPNPARIRAGETLVIP